MRRVHQAALPAQFHRKIALISRDRQRLSPTLHVKQVTENKLILSHHI